MHELFAQVLSRRDLSRAGDVFSLSNSAIVDDLSEALYCIADITSSPDYVKNDNDQAVVEICITRITTAIRDTSSLDLHVKALVNLWETCLHVDLKPGPSGEDPPHAKIASDIMSCLFMHSCSAGFVLQQILDVAVCFLHQGNKEMTRNVTSYLALAAIQNTQLMALHTSSLISSILKGNFTLCCVLPQIYPQSPETIHPHLSQLLVILPDCEETEKSYLLQLVALIAKENPQVLSSHVASLIPELSNPSSSAELILTSLVDIASYDPSPLDACLLSLEGAISRQPSLLSKAVKIFGAVGRLNKESARDCLSFLVHHLSVVDQTSLPAILIEIKSIADQYEGLLAIHLHLIGMQSQSKSTATRMIVQQLLRDSTYSTSPVLSGTGSKQQQQRPSSISETENSSRMSEPDNHPRQYKKRQSSRPQSEVPPQGSILAKPHSEVPLQGPTVIRPLSEIRSNQRHNSRKNAMLSPKSQRSVHSVDRHSFLQHEPPPYHEVPRNSRSVVYNATLRDQRPSKQDLSVRTDMSRNGSNSKLSRRSVLSVQSHYIKENSPPRYNPPPVRPGMERYRMKDSQSSLSDRYDSSVVLRKRANPHISTEGQMIPPGEQNRNSSIHQYLFRRQREMFNYMDYIKTRIPIPQDCTVSGGASGHPVGRVDFFCCQKSMYCIYDKKPFIMDTKHLQPWIHLMFLHLQVTSSSPVYLDHIAVQSLKKIWEEHKSAEGNMTFLKLVTQNFPSPKVQQSLVQQLCSASYYDLFIYDSEIGSWSCFICSNPSKIDALSADMPLIEGQLKEKKVRWKLFKRWRTQYFTLAGERLFPRGGSEKSTSMPIEISKVRSVKTVGRRRDRTIPKAFEIFTDDHKTYMFKAKDGSNAEQWVQCLTLAMHKGKHTVDGSK